MEMKMNIKTFTVDQSTIAYAIFQFVLNLLIIELKSYLPLKLCRKLFFSFFFLFCFQLKIDRNMYLLHSITAWFIFIVLMNIHEYHQFQQFNATKWESNFDLDEITRKRKKKENILFRFICIQYTFYCAIHMAPNRYFDFFLLLFLFYSSSILFFCWFFFIIICCAMLTFIYTWPENPRKENPVQLKCEKF